MTTTPLCAVRIARVLADGREVDVLFCNVDKAASIANLDVEDVLWSLEEEGECTTDTHRITATE